MKDEQTKPEKCEDDSASRGLGLSLGAGIGVALGTGIGVAIGPALGLLVTRSRKK